MKFSTGSFIAGVMLGVLLAGAWFLSGNPPTLSSLSPSSFSLATSTESSSAIQLGQKSDALSVSNQSFGATVTIESVTVPPPGVWVAVREVNGNTLGNVLGAERVAGPRSNVSISLLRNTEPNHLYAVELYRDDNSGAFDPFANSTYIDFDTGNRVIVYFSTN